MRKLIWNNIARRKSQSLLTITITLVTILSFVVVLGVFITMEQGLELSRQRLGADIIVLPEEASADGYNLLFTAEPETCYMDASILDEIAAMEGIEQISPQFYSQTLSAQSCCDFGAAMRVVGFDPDTDFVLAPYFHLQEFDVLQDDEIILGGNFTDFVGKKSLILGKVFTVVGELYPTGTGMDDTIFMNMDTARRITYESDYFQEIWAQRRPEDSISAILLKMEEGVDVERFADQLWRYSGLPIRCVTAGGTISSLEEQLGATVKVLLALWMTAMLIAVLALVGRFNAIAKDRKKEIGLMRAIGFQKSQIFTLILGEACTMALLGGVAGSLLACLCMNPVVTALQKIFFLPHSVWNFKAAVICFAAGTLLSCLMGLLASLHPAIRSAKLEPQLAITQGDLN